MKPDRQARRVIEAWTPVQNEKRIRTNENWYPTAPDGRVRVRMIRLGMDNPAWLVNVWGDDDFGLEKTVTRWWMAYRLYVRLQDHTSQAQMRRWGMVAA